MRSPTLQKIEDFTRQQLKDLLAQCTPQEQEFFLRRYPEGIDKMDAKKSRGPFNNVKPPFLRSEYKNERNH